MAFFLIQKGADILHCELRQGTSILHLLNRFTEPDCCRQILEEALGAGLDVDTALHNGLTPLHAALMGWDYSGGHAVKLLLQQGADPTCQVKNPDTALTCTTPLELCAERLEPELFTKMIDATGQNASSFSRLTDATRRIFFSLGQATRFHHMGTIGKGWETQVESLLRVFVGQSLIEALQTIVINMDDFHIVTLAADFGLGYFVKTLLNILPDDWILRALVDLGADLLYQLPDRRTALHSAAHYCPSLLPELIEAVENLSEDSRRHLTLKQILDTVDEAGYSVFATLLTKGYEAEQRLAEDLRIKYDLDYTYAFQSSDGTCETVVGKMINVAAMSGMLSVNRIQYLLQLTPPPQFVCTPTRETMLTKAVMGPFVHFDDYDLPNHRLVPIIMKTYSDPVYILLGHPYPALHTAAQYANMVALEIFINHIEANTPDQPVPWNLCGENGNTVLDCATSTVAYPSRSEEDSDGLYNIASKEVQKAAMRCYEFLRGKGALHNWELKGDILTARLMCWKVDWKKLADFVEHTTRELGLGRPDIDDDEIVVLNQEDSDAPAISLPVIELVWRFDNFMIRGYRVKITNATWTRTGRAWTREETNDLRTRYVQEWERYHGDDEEQALQRMKKPSEPRNQVA
ncbi:hypothetical protein BJX64DRAFT_295271 [Aspergillus heterothallicus]